MSIWMYNVDNVDAGVHTTLQVNVCVCVCARVLCVCVCVCVHAQMFTIAMKMYIKVHNVDINQKPPFSCFRNVNVEQCMEVYNVDDVGCTEVTNVHVDVYRC